VDLIRIEKELKKRTAYPYVWGRKQDNHFDEITNYIYKIYSVEKLLLETKQRFSSRSDYEEIQNYALNRWYNFWSAMAIENIFCSVDFVEPAKDYRDRLKDFSIKGTSFDHKTSVFPKGFGKDLSYSLENPKKLIEWLYENQSQEQRKHLKNRLFIILHSQDGQHWKLKAEIIWLQKLILEYLKNYDEQKLIRLNPTGNEPIVSDIIWAVQ